MQHIISVENMRQSDIATIEGGVPSLTLMGNAARGILNSSEWSGKISIVTGSGNNGGDGYALACELADIYIPCSVYELFDKYSPDSKYYREKAISKGVNITKINSCDKSFFHDSDIIVDCILGTGFHGEVKGLIKDVISAINNSDAYTISADINSGMNGDTGIAFTAVKSDLTVSIGQLKNGFFLNDAPDFIGKLVNADIGIEPIKAENYLLTGDEFKDKLNEIKSKGIQINELPNIPSGVLTMDDVKRIASDLSGVLFIKNMDTTKSMHASFLIDSMTAWIHSDLLC